MPKKSWDLPTSRAFLVRCKMTWSFLNVFGFLLRKVYQTLPTVFSRVGVYKTCAFSNEQYVCYQQRMGAAKIWGAAKAGLANPRLLRIHCIYSWISRKILHELFILKIRVWLTHALRGSVLGGLCKHSWGDVHARPCIWCGSWPLTGWSPLI